MIAASNSLQHTATQCNTLHHTLLPDGSTSDQNTIIASSLNSEGTQKRAVFLQNTPIFPHSFLHKQIGKDDFKSISHACMQTQTHTGTKTHAHTCTQCHTHAHTCIHAFTYMTFLMVDNQTQLSQSATHCIIHCTASHCNTMQHSAT